MGAGGTLDCALDGVAVNRVRRVLALVGVVVLVGGCHDIATIAAVASASASGAATGNPAIGFAVGVGVSGPVLAEVERVTEVETHFPADPAAASRWLQLRQNWNAPEKSVITVEDIVRVAQMARVEAARRGISFAAAVEMVQLPKNDFH